VVQNRSLRSQATLTAFRARARIVRQLQMLNRSQILFKRSLLVISIVAAYLLILRGAIGFFNPKSGELLVLVNYIGGENSMFWVFEYISAPTYDFLVHSIWGNATAFFTLLFCIFLLALVLTQPKTKFGANAKQAP
jgi:hypothetical protein